MNKNDLYSWCGGATQGFKIWFHPPNETPQTNKESFQLSPGCATRYTVDPRLTVTAKSVRHFDPNIRQCYFASERELNFFKFYTKNNCELECLANYTLKQCGCVQFSMPRTKSVDSMQS